MTTYKIQFNFDSKFLEPWGHVISDWPEGQICPNIKSYGIWHEANKVIAFEVDEGDIIQFGGVHRFNRKMSQTHWAIFKDGDMIKIPEEEVPRC